MTTERSFEERIAAATTIAEIQEICMQAGERRGVLVRERDGSIVVKGLTQPITQPAQAAEPQSAEYLLRRAVKVGDTVTLIEAYSDSGLDILERALRGVRF